MYKKILVVCLALVMSIPAFSGMNVHSGENEQTDEIELPPLENWHYRVPLIVNSGDYNRTDCIVSQEINITKEIGGFGTFDSNSVRVVETNETGFPLWEVISQFGWIDNNSIIVTWIMNDTTPALSQRFYSIYFDIVEYGPKSKAIYPELVTEKINNEQLWIYGEDYELKIDRDRGGSREVKINNVPRKGFVYDQSWQSWHSESLNWEIKGAETELVEDGPIYKKVKVVSKDNMQILYRYFYPDKMKIVFEGAGEISFDTIADNLLNTGGTLVWDDYLFENVTKNYQEYSQPCSYFYILDPKFKSSNDDVKGRSGFWADTIDYEMQTVINAGEKGTRWVLNGNEAWFGFAKNNVISDIVIRSQNPPEITREKARVRMESPVITNVVTLSDQTIEVEGNLTVEEGGNLTLEDVDLTIDGSIVVVNGTETIQNSRCEIISEYDGQHGIYIEQEGELYVYDSIITANTEYYYKFELYGKAEIIDSDISKLWAYSTNLEVGGIQIYSNVVTISGCSIYDSQGSGIFIPDAYKPTITNNKISNCKYGIYTGSSNSTHELEKIPLKSRANEKIIVNTTYGDCWEDIEYEDGTHQITYGVGTYWDNKQQKWMPGNTTLVPSTLEGYDYMCEKNTFKIYFKLNANSEELIKIVYDNAFMSLSFKEPIPNQVVGSIEGSSITYYDVYDHTDITYTILPRELKETITVEQRTSISTYSMKISMENITYRYADDNALELDNITNNKTRSRIEFLNDNNETVWCILSPYITDSNGVSTNNVTLSITDTEFSSIINNISFLDSATYPIFIDPIIEVPTPITTDTVWETGNIYIIRQEVCVYATLTIQPGVIVKLEGGWMGALSIFGRLIAIGNANNPIIFKKLEGTPDCWVYIGLFSNDNIIDFCDISESYTGIGIYSAAMNNIISNSIVHNTAWTGIDLGDYSSNNMIINCYIHNNHYGVKFYSVSSNILTNCMVYSNRYYGILLDSCSNNIINDCIIYDNYYFGIKVWWGSSYNSITECSICNSVGGGIELEYSPTENTITNCNVYNNPCGISLAVSSSSNTITNCVLYSNSYCGIRLVSSPNNNQIEKCNIYKNNYGILSDSTSYSNLIYGNTIKDNVVNAYDESNYANFWNAAYPTGGNYWDDYEDNCLARWGVSASNDYKGETDLTLMKQTMVGTDKFWDRPYYVSGSSGYDYYPIILLLPPVAIAKPYQIIATVGEPREVDGSQSYDPDGTIMSYSWNFDDGVTYTETAQNAPDGLFDGKTKHSYSSVGIYFATLTITDNGGLTDTDYLRITAWNTTIWKLEDNAISDCFIGIYIGIETPLGLAKYIVESPVNIINCTIYNNTYGIYCNQSSPTIKNTCVFWNNMYDIYISQESKPIIINASYNRTRIYLGNTTNTDSDSWTDYQELYVYGFSPYINDPDKENATADFDNDSLTNLNEAEIYGTDPLNNDTDGDLICDKAEIYGTIVDTFSWTKKTEMNVLPDDDGWTLEENYEAECASIIEEAGNKYLHLNFPDEGAYVRWTYYIPWETNSAIGTTTELRVKQSMSASVYNVLFLFIHEMNYGSYFYVLHNYIFWDAGGGGVWIDVDNSVYHTYRITHKNGIGNLYIDGILRKTISLPPVYTGTSRIDFGQLLFGWSSLPTSIIFDVDYIYYSTGGAFAPERPATSYIVDKGTKGYLFYKDAPPAYDKMFNYKTCPLNPDTDFDGQNDYNDLIPLDYDMNGNSEINAPFLVDPTSTKYVERLAIAANNDPNLMKDSNGNFVDDLDMDSDGLYDIGPYLYDNDADADGMENAYEEPHGVANGGWQHPSIYNARYAVVVGGFSDIACENDLLEMYNELMVWYNYAKENIYCLCWDKQNGYAEGRVNGAATKENMTEAFSQIGSKITKNDFFYFSEISHGSGDTTKLDGVFQIYEGLCSFGPMQQFNLTGLLDAYITSYARSLFVMTSCGCCYAINQLHEENRIIITASSPEDYDPEKGYGAIWHQFDDNTHWAFLHQGVHMIYHVYGYEHEPHPGFIPSLWGHLEFVGIIPIWISTPNSIKYAFDKGWDAATSNWKDSPVVYAISHPQLDANGDGIPNKSLDWNIADCTYL